MYIVTGARGRFCILSQELLGFSNRCCILSQELGVGPVNCLRS